MAQEKKQQLSKIVATKAIIYSGAPYDKDIIDNIIPIFDELTVALNPFRIEIKQGEHFEDEDLVKLWEKIK